MHVRRVKNRLETKPIVASLKFGWFIMNLRRCMRLVKLRCSVLHIVMMILYIWIFAWQLLSNIWRVHYWIYYHPLVVCVTMLQRYHELIFSLGRCQTHDLIRFPLTAILIHPFSMKTGETRTVQLITTEQS